MAKKIPVDMVTRFAFVMPIYDYSHVEDESPCDLANSVGVNVYVWNHPDQCWEVRQGFDNLALAKELARSEHIRICKELGVTNG